MELSSRLRATAHQRAGRKRLAACFGWPDKVYQITDGWRFYQLESFFESAGLPGKR
jgi:hypothetical protein